MTVSSSGDANVDVYDDPKKVPWTKTAKGHWQFKCPICDQIRTHLKRHMAIHKQGCAAYPSIFTSAKALKRHKESANPKLYPCDKCGKGFTTDKIQKRHVKEVHSCSNAIYVQLQQHQLVILHDIKTKNTQCLKIMLTLRTLLWTWKFLKPNTISNKSSMMM